MFLAELAEALNSTAVRPIDRVSIAKIISTRREALQAVDLLLSPISQLIDDPFERELAEGELSICRIAQRRFKDAMRIISPDRSRLEQLGIRSNFNFAIAEWGATGIVPVDLFRRVVLLNESSPGEGANYLQCLAIAFWAVGQPTVAERYVLLSRQTLIERSSNEREKVFSAWRYLRVENDLFEEDLNSLQSMISGESEEVPLVFQ